MSSESSPAQHAALNDRFEIIRELGRGGTAVVHLARERSTGAEVAIKVIRSRYLEDYEAVGRFEREARFVTQLDHPNIVPIRSVLDLGSSGMALVMAHIDGQTLRQILTAEGRSTTAATERVMRDIGKALAAAHDRGIVHRDVKPENIFIATDGRAMLADFGLARSMTADTQLSMAGIAIGTPAYMAPELLEGVGLDARADVYSLGIVAWEMLSGHRPWDGQSLYSVLYHQKHELLPDVRDMRDDVPEPLAEVITRAIEKSRESRWPDMRSLLNALDKAATQPPPVREKVSARKTRAVSQATPATPAMPAQPGIAPEPFSLAAVQALLAADEIERSEGPSPSVPALSRRGLVVALLATTAVAAVALTVAAIQERSRETPSTFTVAPVTTADERKPVQMAGALVQPVIADTHPAATNAVSAAPRDTSKTPNASVRTAVLVDPPESASKPSPAPAVQAPQLVAVDASPRPVTAGMSIVAGGMHSCLTNADGRAFCWGNNERGQLGDASAVRATAPLLIGSEARFSTVVAGLSHSCALTRDGAAWCWGSNEHGQLGNGAAGQRLAPVHAATAHTFRAISAGAAHTCGLDADGFAWCWGSNARGQLGDTTKGDHSVPVRAGTSETRFTNITAGWNFTCGLATDGHVSCWGENSAGELGDGTTTDHDRPAQVRSDLAFTSLGAGSAHVCGVTVQHEVYCWGRNGNGQLGDGTTTDRSTPVRVGGTVHFTSITAGAVHTCAVADDGAAYCWGRNTYGQLGNGTDTDQSRPTLVSGGHTFASVHAFGSHTCGATSTGQAFCWGYNLDGQLGDGTRIHRARPVPVDLSNGGR